MKSAPLLAGGIAVLLAAAAGIDNSATTDEPYHVLAAWSHVVEGKADLNSDKPPLPKLLAGAALAPLKLRGTTSPPVERLAHLPDETRRFLYENIRPAAVILAAARAPELLFLVALLWGVHAFARALWGEAGALLALVLAGAQPLVLGHAALVHTDVPAAATMLLALLALHRWLSGAPRGWLLYGALLGLALASKFSALALVPIGALLVASRSRRGELSTRAAAYAGSCLVAVLVVYAAYVPAMRHTDRSEEERTIATIAAQWPGTERAAAALTHLSYVAPPLAHYGLGLLHVYETDRHGQGVNFFMGRTSTTGSPFYFPLALLVKLTVPLLAALIATAALKGAGWTRIDTFLLLPAALLVVAALGSRYNIGARHMLPVVPLLAVFAGQLATWLSRTARAGLLALSAAPAFLAFPHYIAHFNLLAGGSRNGARLLNDSNLDWGQDWHRLAERARREGWSPLSYVYIGPAWPGSELPGARDWINEPAPPRQGFYALSSYAEHVGPDALAYMGAPDRGDAVRRLTSILKEHGAVVDRIGNSITVWRLP